MTHERAPKRLTASRCSACRVDVVGISEVGGALVAMTRACGVDGSAVELGSRLVAR